MSEAISWRLYVRLFFTFGASKRIILGMQGVLLIDKPKGWTSFDAVNYVRKLVAQAEEKKPRQVRVGHTGTLDPMATGLLVLLIGKEYTRRAEELSKLDKTYDVTMKFGEVSTTGDEEGEKTPVSNVQPSPQAVEETLSRFIGETMQTPPIYSAMKVNGQRAYKLARAGKEVVLTPRPVHIHAIRLHEYTYPYVRFSADVGSGTYIRSLVEDIGKALQVGAYMTELRRTKVGSFEVANAAEPKIANIDKLAQM
jgi:tRNA pseudouridine55 synthase